MSGPPTARTTAGQVSGVQGDGVVAFLGVPYAADPYGPHRFCPPAPPERWVGVRPAVSYGATPPKNPYPPPLDQLLPEPFVAGRDCLNLNIWTPDPGRAGLPVLVWIHGGAFTNGSGAVPDYAGDTFARDGVVTVTVNYRLGVDGFAQLEGAPSNRGLLDQIAALRWVGDNIAAFGGDPDRVTIAGESAGAMSVVSLMVMPAAAGLFRRAIAQSGAGHHAITEPTARRIAGYVGERLGVAPTVSAVAEVGLERLLAAQAEVAAGPFQQPDPERWAEVALNQMAFEPVIDGDSLPGLPIDVIAAGGGVDVDLLVGTNRDEQRLFLVPSGGLDLIDDGLLELAAGAWSLPPEGLATYRANRPGASPGEVLADVGGDWFFRIPAVRLAEARTLPVTSGGGPARRPARTFSYEFCWGSSLYDGRLGACHAMEIPFVFDHVDRVTGPSLIAAAEAPRELAQTVHDAWVGFVTDGDPGWGLYERERRATMTFDATSGVVDDPRGDERVVWDGHR